MFGTITGLVVGACSSSVVGEALRNCVRFDTLTKAQKVIVQVGVGGIGMVVGGKVGAEVESTINSLTGGENVLVED